MKLNLFPHEINSPKQTNQKEKIPFVMAGGCKRIYLKRDKNQRNNPYKNLIVIHRSPTEGIYKNLPVVKCQKSPQSFARTSKRIINPAKTLNLMDENQKQPIIVFTSGYFDPLHHGHIELFEKARQLGDKLIVAVNNDAQTMQKKGFVFMPAEEKAKIIKAIKWVDEVIISIDRDTSQCETLRLIKPNIFAKGGDRYAYEIPEAAVCRELGIKIIDGLGAKVQSSSELVKKANELAKEAAQKKA